MTAPDAAFAVEPDGTRTLACRVSAEQVGGALLDILRRAHPGYAEADWREAIASGALTLDGRPTAADAPLAEGMRIACRIPPRPEPAVDDRFDIVFEDAHVAVVSKSGNLPCHPAGRYYANTLLGLLATRRGLRDAALVNRIDRETSGLVLVAKTREAASACGAMMMAGRFDKRYRVLVEGAWPCHDGWRAVRGAIVLVRGDIVRKKRVFRPDETLDPASPAHALTLLDWRRFGLVDGYSADRRVRFVLCFGPCLSCVDQLHAASPFFSSLVFARYLALMALISSTVYLRTLWSDSRVSTASWPMRAIRPIR